MKNSKRSVVDQPEPIEVDPLSALNRCGIAQAKKDELEVLLRQHQDLRLEDKPKAMLSNGYLPKLILDFLKS